MAVILPTGPTLVRAPSERVWIFGLRRCEHVHPEEDSWSFGSVARSPTTAAGSCVIIHVTLCALLVRHSTAAAGRVHLAVLCFDCWVFVNCLRLSNCITSWFPTPVRDWLILPLVAHNTSGSVAALGHARPPLLPTSLLSGAMDSADTLPIHPCHPFVSGCAWRSRQ